MIAVAKAVAPEHERLETLLVALVQGLKELSYTDCDSVETLVGFMIAAASEAGQMKLIASPETVSAMLVGAVSTTVFAWLKTGRARSAEAVASEIATFIQRVLAD